MGTKSKAEVLTGGCGVERMDHRSKAGMWASPITPGLSASRDVTLECLTGGQRLEGGNYTHTQTHTHTRLSQRPHTASLIFNLPAL